MPEGDTVWLAARRMHDALAGSELVSTDFRVPSLATVDLSGRVVREVVSRGKHMLIRVDDDLTLHTHFRMQGSWHLYRRGARWRGGPAYEVRIVLSTDTWDAVGYRMPVADVIARSAEATVVGHLGPDLLADDFDAEEAVRRISAHPHQEIGQALLDQRNLAGIGNLYKAEVCFLEGVSPWAEVASVERLPALVERARRLLRANRERPAQITTGDGRRGHQHWVFERAGRPCRRCGTAVSCAEQGPAPRQRLTYWCPRCQPALVPPPD